LISHRRFDGLSQLRDRMHGETDREYDVDRFDLFRTGWHSCRHGQVNVVVHCGSCGGRRIAK
jgi:hypothetical protein